VTLGSKHLDGFNEDIVLTLLHDSSRDLFQVATADLFQVTRLFWTFEACPFSYIQTHTNLKCHLLVATFLWHGPTLSTTFFSRLTSQYNPLLIAQP